MLSPVIYGAAYLLLTGTPQADPGQLRPITIYAPAQPILPVRSTHITVRYHHHHHRPKASSYT